MSEVASILPSVITAAALARQRKASYPDFEKLDELFGSSRASAVFSDGVSFGSSEQFGFVHFHAVFFGQRFDDFRDILLYPVSGR